MSRRLALPTRLVPPLPTTLAGAELGALIAFVGIRLVDLVQLAVAVPGGLSRATRPGIDGVLLAVFVVESVVIVTLVLRARRYLSARLAWVDTALAFVILALQPVFTQPVDRVGTWTAWGFAVSVGTALGIGIGFPKAWQTWTAATLLAVTYLVVSLPDPSPGARTSAWSNAVAYFGFALIARGLTTYLRRMGRAADAARAEAERLGREREFERHRLLLHDQATVLGLVSQGLTDGSVGESLRVQAGLAAGEIRAFLTRDAGTSDDTAEATGAAGSEVLTAVVRRAASSFSDLPIECTLDLAAGVVLPPVTAAAVQGALRAVLHNIRVHAHAGHVVMHADATTTTWEITVCDDGNGFDPAQVTPGFGLARQLVANLTTVGVTTVIETAPGEGTTITMTGVLATSPAGLA